MNINLKAKELKRKWMILVLNEAKVYNDSKMYVVLRE